MKIEFDPAKNAKNIQQRGLSFERVAEFDFLNAAYLTDNRFDYGEIRQIAVGYLDNRLHVLCFLPIPDGVRVISFRKANAREARKYDKPITFNG
jgi:uncharacterized protein